MIIGNTSKIKQYDLDILKSQINTQFSTDEIIPSQTLQTLKEISLKYKTSFGVITRDAKILAFCVGVELRSDLNEILNTPPYTLHAFYVYYYSPQNNYTREKNYLQSFHLLSFVVAHLKNSFVGGVAIVNSLPAPQIVKVETIEYINKYGLQKIIAESMDLFKNQDDLYSTSAETKRAILLGVGKKNQDISSSLLELSALCSTANIEVVDSFSQTRKMPDKYYYVGVGKLDELSALILSTNANLIIADDELGGQCQSNLQDYLGVEVIDRSKLILDIFARHAKTNEGRLQVELANLKYNLTHLNSYSESLNRQNRANGKGENRADLIKRDLKNKIYKIEKEVEKLKKQRELRRQNRVQNKEKIVSLVGYTNSGKSTLLNKLTKSSVLAENKLFATLDTTTRELFLSPQKKVLLTDTVGFINKLPHEFIKAFASTLEETLSADCLLIVVDNSSQNAQTELNVVEKVLDSLKADNIPKIVVANKMDICKNDNLNFAINYPVCKISARSGDGLNELKNKINEIIYN